MGTELLDREAQLDALAQWWAEAAGGGDGRLVFVGGEAGVGKSSLVRRFCSSLPRGARILAGVCEPLATPVPLGPLFDMAVELPEPIERALLEGGDPVHLRRAFLEELGKNRGGTLALVEDAHWADDATLDLLRHVGRRISGRRVMVLVTYRDDEVSARHPLRVLMGDLATLPEVRHLHLQPLSVAAVERLARDSHLDPAELHRRTGGNPFFLTEVLAADDDVVPATVRDVVLARAARLRPEAREALDAAACLGSRVPSALVEDVSGQSPSAVDQCLEAGMLTLDGELLTFRHELARLAVEESVPGRRAAAYAARALAILRQFAPEQVDSARLADHAERAGDRAALLQYALAAAQRASQLASHREAAAHFGRALAVADHLPDEERAGLFEARAHALYMSHQLEASVEAADAAVELWRRVGDRSRQARCLLSQTFSYLAVARWLPRVEPTVQQAVTLLEGFAPGPELSLACATRASVAAMGFQNTAALEWAERAHELAETSGDPGALCDALRWRGLVRVQSGDDSGWALVEESARMAKVAGLDYVEAWTLWWAYHVALTQRRYGEANRWFAQGMACVTEHGLETTRRFFVAFRARQLMEQGRWDEAERDAATVRAASPLDDGALLVATETLARLRARSGQDATSLLDELERLEVPAKSVVEWIVRAPTALAEYAWLEGQVQQVRPLLESAYDRAVQIGEPWWLGEVAFWLRRAGSLEEPPSAVPEPYRMLFDGRCRDAHDTWLTIGCPYQAAQALACSDDEESLREALHAFEDFRARGEREAVARRLRRLGARDIPRTAGRAPARPRANLSPREIEVLELLSEGRRNAEIAAKLFLSERTVEHHVAAILRKLGTRSRFEATNEARRRGLLATGSSDR
jgi:DNA-binding CsgD family transcriptional regulator